MTAIGREMTSVHLRDCFTTARAVLVLGGCSVHREITSVYAEGNSVQWHGGGGVTSPGKVLEKHLTGVLGLIGFKSEFFLFFDFGIEPLRFSQKSPLFWANNTHLSIWGEGFTFAYLFLSGTILEGIEFWVSLKTVLGRATLLSIYQSTLS